MSVCIGNGGRLPALRIARRGKPHVTHAASAFSRCGQRFLTLRTEQLHATDGATSRYGYPVACNGIAWIGDACGLLSTVRANPL